MKYGCLWIGIFELGCALTFVADPVMQFVFVMLGATCITGYVYMNSKQK